MIELNTEDDIAVIEATDSYVVVDKPYNMLSVPGRGPHLTDCVAARVKQRYPAATGPLTVHRLDMETSGLLVLALDPDTHRTLSRQFQLRQVGKRYVAEVEGSVATEAGVIELPVRFDPPNRPHHVVDPIQGKPASTRWRVVDRQGGRTRIEFEPATGRTHQLRLHAAHPDGLGSPIVGDSLYGEIGPRMLLHATWLEFTDPRTGERVSFASDPPF
jgi:tRNA pseudouridine32 synthase / 23S rRNA pseudouridine746 synthase